MTGGFWCFYLQNVPNQYQPSTQAWRGETGNRVSVDENVSRSTLPSRRVAEMDNRAHVHELWLCLIPIREESKIHLAGNASLAENQTSHTGMSTSAPRVPGRELGLLGTGRAVLVASPGVDKTRKVFWQLTLLPEQPGAGYRTPECSHRALQ